LSYLLQHGISFALGEKLNRGEGSEKTKFQGTVSVLSWVILPIAEELKASNCYSEKAATNKRHEKGKKTEGPNLLFPLFIPNNHDFHDLLACSLQ